MRKHFAVSVDKRLHFGCSRKSPPMPLLPLRAFCLPQHWTKRPYSCLTRCGREVTMDFNAPFFLLPHVTYYQLVASSDNHGLPLPSTFHALHNRRYQIFQGQRRDATQTML